MKRSGRTHSRLQQNLDTVLQVLSPLTRIVPARKASADLPTQVSALMGIAAYGVEKGSTDFRPDYMFMNSARYMFSGDRSVVMAPAGELVAFVKKELLISEGDVDAFDMFMDFGRHQINAELYGKMKNNVVFLHGDLGLQSLLFVPANWFVWETVHSDTCGLRYNMPGDVTDFQSLSALITHMSKHQIAPTLQSVVKCFGPEV